jgi:hypothetical protein
MLDHSRPVRTLWTYPPKRAHRLVAASAVQAGLHLQPRRTAIARLRSTKPLGGPGFVAELGRLNLAVTWGHWSV